MFTKTLRISFPWRIGAKLRHQSTAAAATQDSMLVEINDKNGIATLSMNSKPVNSMTLNFFKDFCEKLDLLEKEKVKGMILTSSMKNVFSSGLDFNEIHAPEESRINAFMLWFQESWIKLYGSSFPTAALINGHAPAGGCVYSLSCEYRVMLPNFTIGLNEAPVGIVPPQFIIEMMRCTISSRQAEKALTLGTLFTSEEALKLGLVDELAADKEDAKARCEAFLLKSLKIPAMARTATKLMYRKDILEMLKNPQARSVDAKRFIDHIMRPAFQRDLENYIAKLKSAKK